MVSPTSNTTFPMALPLSRFSCPFLRLWRLSTSLTVVKLVTVPFSAAAARWFSIIPCVSRSQSSSADFANMYSQWKDSALVNATRELNWRGSVAPTMAPMRPHARITGTIRGRYWDGS
ncbi:hypothetical protein NEOLEDRAFT_114060 [Neolentinus lepideus HHB14362 ss-1]|uniref:Uncharacterized protein n=1 Tax=Neolentinus lepideus HHB14362 ss-1 TaxID=1314782 RepID=A0A165U6G7_9AGAM|nr:hypothetical protein NEOLEDRAFT_114060 [Neolentinus lepideus HHB14362 ss-1]